MAPYTQDQLNEIWRKIRDGESGSATYKPEALPSGPGNDIMSIPINEGTSRRVFERKNGAPWNEVPFMGEKNTFV